MGGGGVPEAHEDGSEGEKRLKVLVRLVSHISQVAAAAARDEDDLPVATQLEVEKLISLLSGVSADDIGLPQKTYQHVLPQSPASATAVRYLQLAEEENQYLVCMFVLPPMCNMPLHDHPKMAVVSKLLQGSMHLTAMDWDRSAGPAPQLQQGEQSRAVITQQLHLHAPSTVYLTATQNNLHQVVAGPEGCTFLDILLPPYKEGSGDRDCSYYNEACIPREGSQQYALLTKGMPPLDFSVQRGRLVTVPTLHPPGAPDMLGPADMVGPASLW